MRTILTCDDVFDVLTRAPFPAGDSNDGDVELHLSACHECRQLAEALRPAVDLIHESIDAQNTLPAYRGSLVERSVSASMQWERRRTTPVGTLAMAAGLAACLLVLVGVAAGSWFSGGNEATFAMTPSDGLDRAELLSLLKVPDSCVQPLESRHVGGNIVRENYRCCTDCHSPGGSAAAARRAIAASAAACGICHDEVTLGVRRVGELLVLRATPRRMRYDQVALVQQRTGRRATFATREHSPAVGRSTSLRSSTAQLVVHNIGSSRDDASGHFDCGIDAVATGDTVARGRAGLLGTAVGGSTAALPSSRRVWRSSWQAV